MPPKDQFSFLISLSVLNHLGRNLYRSFATVLGEAISNSWDADAKNVWIYVNRNANSFFIKDDGVGMTADDFQNEFLKIGYSKRKDSGVRSKKNRPFIGRKGIGKLALLSCAEKITVISKTRGSEYVGGTIDNSGLDRAIVDDLTPTDYQLEEWPTSIFAPYTKRHSQGTIILFQDLKDGIRNSLGFLEEIIALYFRFSLLDTSFSIHLNGKKIDYRALAKLADRTEFLWTLNAYSDPFIVGIRKKFSDENEVKNLRTDQRFKGFIGSVVKPKDLAIMTTDERVGIDLFVNGRLRERNILKHIPTAQIPESYLYGQIHFDDLDDVEDRFTSSREGIVADDPKYQEFLEKLRKDIVLKIVDEWDQLRLKHRKTGDPENESIPPITRKSRELYNVVASDYELPKGSKNRSKVDKWVDGLAEDAEFNFGSYAECFISENLIRKFIEDKKIVLSKEAKIEAKQMRTREADNRQKGNISIAVRRRSNDLSYLSMDKLANEVDKKDKIKSASLSRDANEYKPMRDAVAHTALLTTVAKSKLTSVYENIKGRVRTLLTGSG